MTIRELLPYDLTWPEIDPRAHPFDHAYALDVVRSLEPAGRVPVRPVRRRTTDPTEASEDFGKLCDWSHSVGWDWSEDMTRALVERYGRWSTGWRWSLDEGDLGGGPVGGWCCTLHSITLPEETVERVASALCEWRSWLESLAGWFDRYPLHALPAEDRRDAWERATHHLILQVLDRTGAGDSWYGHCRQVLTWFLTRWDVAPSAARTLVEEAIGGRFASWIAPEGTLMHDVAEQLAISLETHPGEPGPPDPDSYRYTSARVQSYVDE